MSRRPNSTELERIRTAYRERDARSPGARRGQRFLVEAIQRDVRGLLEQHWRGDLSAARVLEVGCGSGAWLRFLANLGADPLRLHGLDLVEARLAAARRSFPEAGWALGTADLLPYADGQFDLVLQFTVFSSVLDARTRRAMAAEIVRVLRPGGAILWYDFVWNPLNRHVVGLGPADIARCFPGSRVVGARVTLAPPLVRLLAPASEGVCRVLARLPWLRTHYLALIRPEGG